MAGSADVEFNLVRCSNGSTKSTKFELEFGICRNCDILGSNEKSMDFGSEGMAKFKSGIELNGDGEGVGVKLRADVDAMLKAPVGELDPPLDFEVGLFCIVELRRCFCICNERREVAGRENVSSTHLERESLLSVSNTATMYLSLKYC